MKNKLMNKTNKMNKIVFKVQKHSPEILAVTGTIGVIGSIALACKTSMKLPEILEETKDTLDTIKKTADDPKYAEKYSQEDATKDISITYIQTAVKIAKLYLPTAALTTASLVCLLSSNNILRKRNAALSAAYATLDKSFKGYRKRVAERFGEEVENEIRYNIKAKEITSIDENGNEVTETVKAVDGNPVEYSDYARFFDESCAAWKPNAEYNLMFLKAQQNYANDLLVSRGRLFLNEVYRMLGIDDSKAGQVVGWVYDPDNPVGDNYVDFGIYNPESERARAFVNGYEPNILLDFNVDGNIWDLM